jgi:hypothetical protein
LHDSSHHVGHVGVCATKPADVGKNTYMPAELLVFSVAEVGNLVDACGDYPPYRLR